MEYCRQTGIGPQHAWGVTSGELDGLSPQQLVRVKLEAAAEPDTGFVLMLGNGRRIASGWGFSDAELARLIRVAESA